MANRTDPTLLAFWRELHAGYTQTGFGYEVICRQFKEALNEIDRLNALQGADKFTTKEP